MMDKGLVERVSRGKYRSIHAEPPPLPKVKDDTEDATHIRIVNGVVTTEDGPDRGYGR